jgi:DNA primase
MFLPDGHDPDTLVAEEGRGAFEARLRTALPLSDYIVQHLTPDIDLNHEEGRARLKAVAAPLFGKMPEGVYRELLADRLVAIIRMPASKLKEHLFATESGLGRTGPTASSSSGAVAGRPRAVRASAGRGSLLSQAITLVLHHPAAARSVTHIEALGTVDKPGVGVLKELLQEAAAMAEPSTGMLLERWRERPEYRRLSELAITAPMVADASGTVKELQMAVERLLEESGPGRRMDDLLRKAQETGLNSDEKAELSMLLKSKTRPRAPTQL